MVGTFFWEKIGKIFEIKKKMTGKIIEYENIDGKTVKSDKM